MNDSATWRKLTSAERVRAVRRLVEPPTGLTYTEAATRLGTTRTAIAGVVYRHGIKSANSVAAKKQKQIAARPKQSGQISQIVQQKANRARTEALRPIPSAPPLEPDVMPPTTGWQPIQGYVAIEDHMEGGCRWPVDGPAGGIAHFCNLPVSADGRPWCAAHDARAWRTPAAPRPREAPRARTFYDLPT